MKHFANGLFIALLLGLATSLNAGDSSKPGTGWWLGPVNVISMTSGDIATDQFLFVEHGKIRSISTSAPNSGNVIDGMQAYVIPGLAEMHAHVPSRRSGEQRARDILMLYLANGITTARGMLGESWHLELREDLATGAWKGPRLVTSGPSLNGNSVSSPEQAMEKVVQQAKAGYDFLKLHPGLDAAEFTAIAEAARANGLPFAGHVSWQVGLDAALAEKQDSIDHLDGYAEALVPESSDLHGQQPAWFGVNLAPGMDPDLIPDLARRTAEAGVWNVPTQTLLENLAGALSSEELMARPGMAYVGNDQKSSWLNTVKEFRSQVPAETSSRFIEIRRALILALQQSGAGLLLGSDAPQIMNVPGFSLHEELELMVASGLTPLQALQSGTINVAQYLGEEGHSGDIAQGHVADFVLLENNPLEDIAASRSILGVSRAGHWFDRASLDKALADIRSRGL